MADTDKLLEEIQDQCEYFAKDIITRLCKRAIRKMNTCKKKSQIRLIHGANDYPAYLPSLIFYL